MITPKCFVSGCEKPSVHIVHAPHPMLEQVKLKFRLCPEHFNSYTTIPASAEFVLNES